MTRLGSKMTFRQAVEEMRLGSGIEVEESTLRQTTHRHGAAAETIERDKVAQLEREMTPSTAQPERVVVSNDGAFIHLTSGEWREVKTMVIGEFESQWQAKTGQVQVKTSDISYYSRSYRIREYERYALLELHRRGVSHARLVVTVNDGAEWTVSFADYHLPQATRILDFQHALDHLKAAGRAVLGENSDAFRQWFAPLPHQLKHQPPQRTIVALCLLASKATSDEQLAVIDDCRRYLQKREAMIDYAHFLAKGYPIGSGSAESSHKVVVHSRLKQAGMRWAESHVDPMLTLRTWVCNERWSQEWPQLATHYWHTKRQEFVQRGRRQRPSGPPLTFADVQVAEPTVPASQLTNSTPTQSEQPYRPAEDHPWRQGIWPTKEAWRWN